LPHLIPTQDLDSVDITTPLRADEVFTVQKHREVPVSMSSAFADIAEDAPEEGKKKKSSKKPKEKDLLEDDSKKGRKDKDKSKKTKAKPEPADDLLMMDWNDPPMPSMPVMVVTRPVAAVDSTSDKKEKEKDKGKDKESKGKKISHLWLPLLNDKTVDIYYATSVQSNIVTITLKAVNSSKTGSSVSVTATFNSSAGVRPATPSNSNLRVAQQDALHM
jgi:hypothetical protein